MVITPVQFVVSSAITQKSALSTASGHVAPAVNSSGSTAAPGNAANVPSVPSKFIETSSLHNAAANLAGIRSQLDTAGGGAQQITKILQNLHNVAVQIANSDGSNLSAAELEAEFHSLYTQIDQIASNVSFGGSKLLDGSFALDNSAISLGASAQNSPALVIPNLSTQALLAGNPPNLTSPEGISETIAALGNAKGAVDSVNADIDSASARINFTMASIETAQANAYASASILTESDLGGGTGLTGFISVLLGKPLSSANTQTGKISDKLLNLIGD